MTKSPSLAHSVNRLDENLCLIISGNVTLCSRETLKTNFFFLHTAIMKGLLFPIAYVSIVEIKIGLVQEDPLTKSTRKSGN